MTCHKLFLNPQFLSPAVDVGIQRSPTCSRTEMMLTLTAVPSIFAAAPSRGSWLRIRPCRLSSRRRSYTTIMDLSGSMATSNLTVAQTPQNEEPELLQSFYSIPNIDKAWASQSKRGTGMDVVVAMSQINLPANIKRTYMSYLYVPEANEQGTNCHWSPFPFELNGAAVTVPSPSGTKVLVVYNTECGTKDNPCSVKLQIWGSVQLLKEIHIPTKLHGAVYTDGWFEGVAWSHDETCIAYVAEEPAPSRPVFGQTMFRAGQSSKSSNENEAGTWKGQGDWVEDWGECYSGKRRPTIYVADTDSGVVQAVDGISQDVSVGQVVWAPPPPPGEGVQLLVFVGWTSQASNFKTPRKLGMKYCYNRPCALYAVEAPKFDSESPKGDSPALKLTTAISSAISPRFSPDGKFLVFLSAKAAVDSGAHCATNSLHCIQWPAQGILGPQLQIRDVVPVMMRPDEKGFPGLYCSNFLSHPWLYDNCTLLVSSVWRSTQVILSVNIESGEVCRVTPEDSTLSWSLLSVWKNLLVAVVSNPGTPPSLKVAHCAMESSLEGGKRFQWSDIPTPVKHADKVLAVLSSIACEILQIRVPLSDQNASLPEGAKQPFEAILVSPRRHSEGLEQPPLVVVLHGGPHSVSLTGFSRTAAFLLGLGFSLLHVNYRGSLGFGEESLQCLLGNVGQRDVADVLAALDVVIAKGLAKPDKVAVVGGSHGGFLASHLIGQAPDRFLTAVLRNPVCNISSMVGVTDIPDWCFMESYGKPGLAFYSEAPSVTHLDTFYQASPIAHLEKVKVPTLFLLGAQDRRVPVSNGLQYAQALRARGLEVKIIVFPEDIHAIDRPQSEFESFVNIGTWLKRFL